MRVSAERLHWVFSCGGGGHGGCGAIVDPWRLCVEQAKYTRHHEPKEIDDMVPPLLHLPGNVVYVVTIVGNWRSAKSATFFVNWRQGKAIV